MCQQTLGDAVGGGVDCMPSGEGAGIRRRGIAGGRRQRGGRPLDVPECDPAKCGGGSIVTSQHSPEIDSSHLVTFSQDELRTIAGMGAMSRAPGTQTAGVVLWDEQPQPSSVVGTKLSRGNSNQQTIGVTNQGY